MHLVIRCIKYSQIYKYISECLLTKLLNMAH
ncbi:hypothetical protein HDC32_002593 [Pseudomonas sp. JAI120]|nr:hypothetical protein [Pseudomonas sp. SJZ073]MBB6312895.1 hypothetical protein [Pseudomonas sp. JAI120]